MVRYLVSVKITRKIRSELCVLSKCVSNLFEKKKIRNLMAMMMRMGDARLLIRLR